MCRECNGTGKQHTEVFPGAWQIGPCSCVEVSREDWKAELIELRERLRLKREKLRNKGENGCGPHRELLPAT